MGNILCFFSVPGHCDIVGNEWADADAANDGCAFNPYGVECLRSSVTFA